MNRFNALKTRDNISACNFVKRYTEINDNDDTDTKNYAAADDYDDNRWLRVLLNMQLFLPVSAAVVDVVVNDDDNHDYDD